MNCFICNKQYIEHFNIAHISLICDKCNIIFIGNEIIIINAISSYGVYFERFFHKNTSKFQIKDKKYYANIYIDISSKENFLNSFKKIEKLAVFI